MLARGQPAISVATGIVTVVVAGVWVVCGEVDDKGEGLDERLVERGMGLVS